MKFNSDRYKVLHLEDRNKMPRSGNRVGNIGLDNIMNKADSGFGMDHMLHMNILYNNNVTQLLKKANAILITCH